LLEIGVPYSCAHCGLRGEWQGKPLVLHIDHIDGNYEDCRRENLRFLCPNRHTQTPSWAGRNKVMRSYHRPPPPTSPLGGFTTLHLFEADPDRIDEAS
jgi:5-methylcytosine-specific restriction endonuclease McrA